MRKYLPLLSLCTGFFMVIVDVMIVNIALPTMATALHANLTDLQWIIDGYALTFAAFLLLAGYLGDRFGAKTIFNGGMILFALTSLACGLSNAISILLIARLLQGFAATLLVPTSLSLIREMYHSPAERAHAISIWGAVGGVGAAMGPVLGGVLTAYLGWRSIFLINVPIGLIGFIATRRYLKNTLRNVHLHFDVLGQILAVIFIATLAFALIEMGRLGWTNVFVEASFVLCIVSLAGFILIARKTKSPMLPLEFFKVPDFSVSMFLGLAMCTYLYGSVFLLPLYLQHVKLYSVLQTSVAVLPLTLFNSFGSFFSGKLTNRYGARFPILLGFTMGLVGFVLLLLEAQHVIPYLLLLIAMMLWGVGISFAMPAATFVIIHSVPSEKTGTASAAFHTSRQIGGLVGVALFGTFLNVAPSFSRGMEWICLLEVGVCAISLYCAWRWLKKPFLS